MMMDGEKLMYLRMLANPTAWNSRLRRYEKRSLSWLMERNFIKMVPLPEGQRGDGAFGRMVPTRKGRVALRRAGYRLEAKRAVMLS